MKNKKIPLIIMAVWFVIVFGWVVKSEYTLKGQEILLQTVPVDPRDLLMGDYVILNYKIGQFDFSEKIQYRKNATVYAVLELDKNKVATVKEYTYKKPQNELYLKGQMKECDTAFGLFKAGSCIKYGIESYYVKEGSGRTLEKQLRDGTLVKVAVDKNGNAKVKGFAK